MRAQYLADVKRAPELYKSDPVLRVAGLYGTARKGNISRPLANQIWESLLPLRTTIQDGALPTRQDAYDKLVIERALGIQAVLQAVTPKRGGFGIGQKIVNLFMKDHWALDLVPREVEFVLHAPLDRIVLTRFGNVPSTWESWTKVVAAGPQAKEVLDYLTIQQRLREYREQCAIQFPSVIQMEQFIWHRV